MSKEIAVEQLLAENVEYLLRQYVVYRLGTQNFGLAWTSHEITATSHVPKSGGWMLKKSAGIRGYTWKKRFCVIEEQSSYLQLCKNEGMLIDVRIPFKNIISVQACYSSANQHYHLLIRTLSKRSDDQIVNLRPIEDFNNELVVRWAAFLTYKCKLYDEQLQREQEAASLAAVGIQAAWRGKLVRLHPKQYYKDAVVGNTYSSQFARLVSRIYREKTNKLSDLDLDSSRPSSPANSASTVYPKLSTITDQVGKPGMMQRSHSNPIACDTKTGSPLSSTVPSSVRSPTQLPIRSSSIATINNGTASGTLMVEQLENPVVGKTQHNSKCHLPVEQPLPHVLPSTSAPEIQGDFAARNRKQSIVSNVSVQTGNAKRLAALAPGEVEDEIWENQRWQAIAVRGKVIQRGWGGDISLLPTDRATFTDRLGRGNWDSPYNNNVPVPDGWRITTPFTVDTSGVIDAKCSAEGWAYQTAFPQLDSDFARDSTKTLASPLWLVRRRRWYRRRVPIDPDTPVHSEVLAREKGVVFHGWLGIRASNTHRWKSRWCIVVEAEPKTDSNVAQGRLKADAGCLVPTFGKYAHWSYFKNAIRQHDEDGTLTYNWNEVKSKFLKSRLLSSSSIVSDAVASPTCPGYFTLQQSPIHTPRLFNAYSASNRKAWMEALRKVIASSYEISEEQLVRIQNANGPFSLRETGWQVMRTLNRALRMPADIVLSSPRDVQQLRKLGSGPSSTRGPSIFNTISSKGSGSADSRTLGQSTQRRRKASSFDSANSICSSGLEGDSEVQPCANTESDTGNDNWEDQECEESGDVGVSADDDEEEDEDIDLSPEVETSTSRSITQKSSQPWSPPEVLENELTRLEFNVPVDDLHEAMYLKDGLEKKLWKAQELSQIVAGSWSNGVSPGSTRDINYMMPKKGVVPANRAYINMKYVQVCPGQGYQIDVDTTNPGVPYGSTFITKLQYTLSAKTSETSELVVSHTTQFISSTMFKTFIKIGSKREILEFHQEVYNEIVKDWISYGANPEKARIVRKNSLKRSVLAPRKDSPVQQRAEQPQIQPVRQESKWMIMILIALLLIATSLAWLAYELRTFRIHQLHNQLVIDEENQRTTLTVDQCSESKQ